MDKKNVGKKIAKLLTEQKFGILATLGKGYPYQSIVAFAGSADMKHIFFATKRATSKYKNLKDKAQVSIFIDNRSNQEADFIGAIGMTALGNARELSEAARRKFIGLFIRKHPSLEEFLASPDCALFMIKVRVYYIVWNFEQVIEVRVS